MVGGSTDEAGVAKFQMIFGGEEGLPPGEYHLTFTWPEMNNKMVIARKAPGEEKRLDRFKGKYSTVSKQSPRIKVEDGKKNDFGKIDLKK